MDPIKDKKNENRKKNISRRKFLKGATAATITTGGAMVAGCGPSGPLGGDSGFSMAFKEYFKEHYRLMTPEEQNETVVRLEKLARIKRNENVKISTDPPLENVLYGYAFNVTRCEGYMECVQACVKENNLDRKSKTQYIRIFEMEHGKMTPDQGNGKYFHEVPVEGHFYTGVQCFQCENPPCVKACPTKATWKEPDGIVVVDYDWCIGCRYCMAACPYWGRRFNWNEPEIPKNEVNKNQHYLGNRRRVRGMMEKCTFCIQRSRKGKLTACAEACPTGARVFGNLLDPESEIRFVLANKKVYRLKEDLGTDPKFWFFID